MPDLHQRQSPRQPGSGQEECLKIPAGTYDLQKITQGDTILETFALQTDADSETPYDLTGATFAMQFRTAAEDQGGTLLDDVSAYLSAGDDPTLGIVTLSVPDTVTADWDTSSVETGGTFYAHYDLRITDSDGNKFTWLAGRLPVTPAVTA